MPVAFNCMATGVGSLPHVDPEQAVALSLRYLPEAPIWPQLPLRDFREHFHGQYSEALPGLVADPVKQSFFFDTYRDLSREFEIFYEQYLGRNYKFFKVSEEYAAGLY